MASFLGRTFILCCACYFGVSRGSIDQSVDATLPASYYLCLHAHVPCARQQAVNVKFDFAAEVDD